MLTRHQHMDVTSTHIAPGIDDTQSEMYRDYDRCGRIQNAFMQRAAFAGIKNLNSASFRNDSPLQVVQSRFPEKYMGANSLDFNKMTLGGPQQATTTNFRRMSTTGPQSTSYNVIQSLFPPNNKTDTMHFAIQEGITDQFNEG